MATKAQIQTKINTISDGGNSPATRVRGVLGTDPESLLEAIYSDAVEDTQLLETYTTSNANFNYAIRIYKVGSNISINGNFTAINSVSDEVVFTITDAEYLPEVIRDFFCAGVRDSETIGCRIDSSEDTFKIDGTMFAGESFNFSINYKARN